MKITIYTANQKVTTEEFNQRIEGLLTGKNCELIKLPEIKHYRPSDMRKFLEYKLETADGKDKDIVICTFSDIAMNICRVFQLNTNCQINVVILSKKGNGEKKVEWVGCEKGHLDYCWSGENEFFFSVYDDLVDALIEKMDTPQQNR